MSLNREECLERLNGPDGLAYLRTLISTQALPEPGRDVNNHIHTTYSFSPYSPTAAVYFARAAGLSTCGLIDHDSIAGAGEFLEAARAAHIGPTIGLECRVLFRDTPFSEKNLNTQDQKGLAYVVLHGVPHGNVSYLNDRFALLREKRNDRNRAMVRNINGIMGRFGITIDFDRDVLPLSMAECGGTVTERHLASALSLRMLDRIGRGQELVSFIRSGLHLPISQKVEDRLLDGQNPYMMYDLLGWIKSELISQFYIDAVEECMHVQDMLRLAEEIGAIPAYAYLGDVTANITGDRRLQKFEDDYLDDLVPYLARLGFRAITYMPSRNTKQQLSKIQNLCRAYGLLQISGEDINSPRQSFVCEAQRDPSCAHLYDSTWALIAHEWLSSSSPEEGFFSEKSISACPDLDARILSFSAIGQQMFRDNTGTFSL